MSTSGLERDLVSTIHTLGWAPAQLQPEDEEDLDFSANTNFMRMALNLTLGAEYNLTGNTNLYLGAGFHNGFTNLFNGGVANRILDPAPDGTPALSVLNQVIPTQQKKASTYYVFTGRWCIFLDERNGHY